MSREKETEIYTFLRENKHSPAVKKMVELLTMSRAKCLEQLEKADDPETRGRSKFCKELIKILSE